MLDKYFFLCYNTKENQEAIAFRPPPKETTRMNKKSRILIFLFAAIFAVAVLSSFFFSAPAAGHDCVGGECTVCAVLDACHDFLGKAGEGVAASAASLYAIFSVILVVSAYSYAAVEKSPVKLKVRLIN